MRRRKSEEPREEDVARPGSSSEEPQELTPTTSNTETQESNIDPGPTPSNIIDEANEDLMADSDDAELVDIFSDILGPVPSDFRRRLQSPSYANLNIIDEANEDLANSNDAEVDLFSEVLGPVPPELRPRPPVPLYDNLNIIDEENENLMAHSGDAEVADIFSDILEPVPPELRPPPPSPSYDIFACPELHATHLREPRQSQIQRAIEWLASQEPYQELVPDNELSDTTTSPIYSAPPTPRLYASSNSFSPFSERSNAFSVFGSDETYSSPPPTPGRGVVLNNINHSPLGEIIRSLLDGDEAHSSPRSEILSAGLADDMLLMNTDDETSSEDGQVMTSNVATNTNEASKTQEGDLNVSSTVFSVGGDDTQNKIPNPGNLDIDTNSDLSDFHILKNPVSYYCSEDSGEAAQISEDGRVAGPAWHGSTSSTYVEAELNVTSSEFFNSESPSLVRFESAQNNADVDTDEDEEDKDTPDENEEDKDTPVEESAEAIANKNVTVNTDEDAEVKDTSVKKSAEAIAEKNVDVDTDEDEELQDTPIEESAEAIAVQIPGDDTDDEPDVARNISEASELQEELMNDATPSIAAANNDDTLSETLSSDSADGNLIIDTSEDSSSDASGSDSSDSEDTQSSDNTVITSSGSANGIIGPGNSGDQQVEVNPSAGNARTTPNDETEVANNISDTSESNSSDSDDDAQNSEIPSPESSDENLVIDVDDTQSEFALEQLVAASAIQIPDHKADVSTNISDTSQSNSSDTDSDENAQSIADSDISSPGWMLESHVFNNHSGDEIIISDSEDEQVEHNVVETEVTTVLIRTDVATRNGVASETDEDVIYISDDDEETEETPSVGLKRSCADDSDREGSKKRRSI